MYKGNKMPHRERTPESERLGQVIAIMADMGDDHDALEDRGGPKCGRHVVRIIATAEMLMQAKYRHDSKGLLREVLMRVAEATASNKDPLIEIERWMNRELNNSIACLIMH